MPAVAAENGDVTVLRSTWVGAAALAVLASGAVAAVTLTAPPAAPAPQTRVVAASQAAPAPVALSFPAPAPVAAPVDPLCAGSGWQERRGARAVERLRPAGDYAETYAQWQRGARTSRSELAPAPSAAELERLAVRFF